VVLVLLVLLCHVDSRKNISHAMTMQENGFMS
jgi:hypothetical protein